MGGLVALRRRRVDGSLLLWAGPILTPFFSPSTIPIYSLVRGQGFAPAPLGSEHHAHSPPTPTASRYMHWFVFLVYRAFPLAFLQDFALSCRD